jgi:cell division protein FtsI (penicillin-binding protein 3)
MVMNGYAKETDHVMAKLNVKRNVNGKGEWMKADVGAKAVSEKRFDVKENMVPDVTGMSLKDALFLLENKGLSVKVLGRGKIVRQSIASGSTVAKGSQIVIELL